ncbi:MAG: thioredoxin [Prevotellaceae bacterium]|nr:thioredoxin [Prevotellaceae bacterium]
MAMNINDQNFQELISSGKPAVVDFWAVWCGPCRRMTPIIEELAEQYAGRVNIGKCNVDESQSLAAQFGVMSIPTVVFFNASGEEVSRIVGAQSKARVEEEIKQLLN